MAPCVVLDAMGIDSIPCILSMLWAVEDTERSLRVLWRVKACRCERSLSRCVISNRYWPVVLEVFCGT